MNHHNDKEPEPTEVTAGRGVYRGVNKYLQAAARYIDHLTLGTSAELGICLTELREALSLHVAAVHEYQISAEEFDNV